MRILRVFSTIILLSLSLYAVPKFFFVRTYGTPDGVRYDVQRNLIYVGSPQTSQVLAVSPDTGQTLKSAYVPNAGGLDITPDGKQLVVGTTAFDGWYGDTFLTFVDLDTFTVAERIPISNPLQEDSGEQGGVYSPQVRRVVALFNGNILFTVSPPNSSGNWIGKYDHAKHTFSMISDGRGVLIPSDDRKHVLLPNMGYNAGLQLFDAEADTVTVSNPGLNNVGVAFSHDGKLVAYAFEQHQVLILDATTLQPIRKIATPSIGVQVAFSMDNSKVFVEKFATSAFYVFDVNTGLLQGAFSMPGDDHDTVNLLGMDSRGMLYSSLERGLAVTDSSLVGNVDPQSQSYGTAYTYVASPSAGPISGGTAVNVRHSYPSSPTIYFADKIATITGSDSSGVQVTAPPGDRTGPVDITIRYSDGYVAYIPEGFSYGPSIEYLDHNGGNGSGGDSLTLFALGLRSAAGATVLIGGAPAIVTSVSEIGISPMKSPTYRINLRTPGGNAGPADVTLLTQDGSATLKGGFEYVPMTNLGGEIDVTQMLYDDTRGYLYRCDNAMKRIEVLDTATGQYIKQYVTHPGPLAMALSPDRSTLYVTASAGFIDVIDLNSDAQQSMQLNLPAGMTMTRIGLTSKGTLFVGIYNPSIIYDSRLIEVNPSTGSFTTRLQHFNGNYLELGQSRDGTRAFISSDLAGGSGNTLYYWDAFTDSFRQQGVPGWSDYGIDDTASLLLGGGLTYDSGFRIHNTFESFDFDVLVDAFVWGEKLDDSGAIAIRPSRNSLVIYDVHHGNRILRVSLPSLTLSTVDAMSFDSAHATAYLSTTTGLLKVELPDLLGIGRIEPAQGLTSGGQKIVVRGIGFQQHATVTIGGQPAPTQFVNGTTLQVTTPALPLGTAAVQVTNDDGRTYSLPGAYSAVDTQPIIATNSPSQLRIGDGFSYQTFSIVGMNFFPGAVALWNGSPRPTYFIDDTELDVYLKAADTVSPGAATLTVRNPDGGLSNEITIAIKDHPHVSLPTEFSFPTQLVSTQSAVQTGTVRNSGTSAVSLTFSAGNPFALTTDCPMVLAAGASCTLTVIFSPTAPGTYSSAIAVRGDITANVPLRGVSGVATATLSASPGQLKFPSTKFQSVATVIVTNIGIPAVTINKVSTDSSDFSASSYGGPNLNTGETSMISVTFQPTAAGTRTGNLVIESTAGTTTVPLTGTSQPRQLGFDTTALTILGIVGQATASKAVTTFTNTGATGVTLTGVSITATSTKLAFSQTNNCPTVLNGGTSCQITVSYIPSGAATDTANLVVTTNIAYNLPITGAMTDFALSGSASMVTVSAGETATYPLSVDTSGGYHGDLSFSCTGAPANSTCTVTPQTLTAASGVTTVSVTVKTTGRTSASSRWPGMGFSALAMVLIGCVFLGKSEKHKSMLILLVLSVCAFSACGGGGSGGATVPPPPITTGTPAGTYPLTVTAATPDGATRNTSLTLHVN